MMKEVLKETTDLPVSSLRMDHVMFDAISFDRHGFRKNKEDVKTKFRIDYGYEEVSENQYHITLVAEAKREDEYTAKVQLSAYCTVNANEPHKQQLIEQNALAILFPYVRSEMTLLTSQPEVEPIVWPVMNINKLMKKTES